MTVNRVNFLLLIYESYSVFANRRRDLCRKLLYRLGYGLDNPGSNPGKGKKFLSSLKRPHRPWCTPQPPIQQAPGLFPMDEAARDRS